MTLKDLMMKYRDEELTVFDKDYEMEAYFYGDGDEDLDVWGQAMLIIASKLNVEYFDKKDMSVVTNLSEVIENAMPRLRGCDLFYHYDIDYIMYDITSILAGNVSENWLIKFAKAL